MAESYIGLDKLLGIVQAPEQEDLDLVCLACVVIRKMVDFLTGSFYFDVRAAFIVWPDCCHVM